MKVSTAIEPCLWRCGAGVCTIILQLFVVIDINDMVIAYIICQQHRFSSAAIQHHTNCHHHDRHHCHHNHLNHHHHNHHHHILHTTTNPHPPPQSPPSIHIGKRCARPRAAACAISFAKTESLVVSCKSLDLRSIAFDWGLGLGLGVGSLGSGLRRWGGVLL